MLKLIEACLKIAAQSDYNTRKAGITSAIVIAVLIPVGICGFCLIVHLREKASDKAFNKNQAYTFQRNDPATATNNSIVYKPAPPKAEQDSKPQENGRKMSKHEGEYYTNEPLDMYTRN